MADVVNHDLGKRTVDFIDNTIGSDAKPIEPFCTVEFDGLRGKWITW